MQIFINCFFGLAKRLKLFQIVQVESRGYVQEFRIILLSLVRVIGRFLVSLQRPCWEHVQFLTKESSCFSSFDISIFCCDSRERNCLLIYL